MDYKKILTGVLSKALSLDTARIEEILDEKTSSESSIIDTVLEEDAARIAKLKPKAGETPKEKFQEGYKKGKAEVLDNFEKELKEEYGIDSDLKGKELMDHIVQTKTADATKGKKSASEMTEDEIKASPAFRKLEKALAKQLEEKEKEFQESLENTKKGFEKEQTFGTFSQEALKHLDGLKPILPKNATAATNLKATFAKSLLQDGIEISKEGNDFFLVKDGKRLEDKHGHAIKWQDYVADQAKGFFDFEENNGGSNSGNSNQGNEGGSQGAGNGTGKKEYPKTITKPTNLEEYSKIVNDKSIPFEDRKATMEAWNEDTARTG